MGFLSKAFKKVKKQIQPDNMMIGSLPKRPRRGGGFLSKIRNKAFDRIESGKIPARSGFLRGQYFGPRGNMGSDFTMPIKRGGGMGGLGEAIRRLQEKRGGDMGMPRMEGMDDGRMRAMPIGPGDRLQIPQPIPERMPTDPSSYYNPTIFGQQMGDMDFSQMPEISPIDMSNLQMPTLPREISQMDLPQMPEGLPSMQDVQGGRSLNFADYKPQDRMMMAEGDEVIQSLDQKINNLLISRGYPMDVIADLTPREKLEDVMRQNDGSLEPEEIAAYASANRENYMPQEPKFGLMARAQLSGGGYVNGYAEGDEVMMMQGNEIESMLSGMDSEESGAMDELEQMAPEMEMIDQLVMMVAQMIQQGAGEEEVIGFLREQGLDDEDIGTVLQLVTEMSETEEMAEDQIGNELAQLG